ncbi:testis-specific protein TEX28 [Macrotis lagotis]|uniref:testis-specific protein TEX28 n=1 Tax=Macrotis lagotis TaxID=92651 RepID=UPI003D68F35C
MKNQSSPYLHSCPTNQDRSISINDKGSNGNPSKSTNENSRNHQNNVKHRILYLSEQLKLEKTIRDENTVGYLKLVSKADRHQAAQVRQAFEKMNQRSSATIAHIERKLRRYFQQLQEIEQSNRAKYSSLKEEKVNKNQEPANKDIFVENSKLRGESSQFKNSLDSIEEDVLAGAPQEKSSKKDSMTRGQKLLFLKIKEELRNIKESHSRLELSYQALKEKNLSNLQLIIKSLQEEKYRQRMIEEQINDHKQGYLGEISHTKLNLSCTEEKMVYLSYERAKEIWEVMGTFQKRISKLEIQQQAVQLEIAKTRSYLQIFLAKFMNLLLTLTNIILVCVSTICTCPLPFFKCRYRTGIILFLMGLGVFTWQKWYSIPYMYWHEWIFSRLKSFYRDSRPLPR